MNTFDFIQNIINNAIEDSTQNLLEKSDVSNLASTVPDGGEFIFCGIPFIRLGEEQGGILCITKQNIFRSIFNNRDNNDYRESIVRYKILEAFLPLLNRDELLPFEMNLTTVVESLQGYGGCTDYVGILTDELFIKYKQYISINDRTWLCTPYSLSVGYRFVDYVGEGCRISASYADREFWCRPACIFKKSS